MILGTVTPAAVDVALNLGDKG